MKKIVYLFVVVFSLFFFCGENTFGQSVILSGEVRPRYEFRHGYKTIMPDGEKAANFISQRTRLNAFYGSKFFKFGLVLQDVRVWGDVTQLNKSDLNGLSIHQAWGEVIFNKKLSVKLGRQEISYDDQRIFGNVGWTQQARSHDAAIIKYRPVKSMKIDVGIAYNANGESLYKTDYTVNNYRTFQYIWYHGTFNKFGLSFLMLNNGMPHTNSENIQKVVYSQTIGSRLTFKNNALKFAAAFYYQGGKNRLNNALSATYFSAAISYNITKVFTAGVSGEYLSGTSSVDQVSKEAADHSFKPLYGTNHKFNGWMDYFYVGSYMFGNGLTDFSVPLTVKANKLTFKLVPHFLLASAKVSEKQKDNSWKDYNNYLGTEFDLSASYNLSKAVKISAGYSQMLATESLQVIKSGNYKNSNNWGWLMITFKPVFFSKK